MFPSAVLYLSCVTRLPEKTASMMPLFADGIASPSGNDASDVYASSTATNWMPEAAAFLRIFINQYGGDEIIDARVKARVALRVDSHQLSAQRGGPAENRARFHARAPVDYDFRRHVESAVDFASVQERGGPCPFHRDYVRLYAGQSAHLFYLVPQPREFAAQHFLFEQEARFTDVVRNRG